MTEGYRQYFIRDEQVRVARLHKLMPAELLGHLQTLELVLDRSRDFVLSHIPLVGDAYVHPERRGFDPYEERPDPFVATAAGLSVKKCYCHDITVFCGDLVKDLNRLPKFMDLDPSEAVNVGLTDIWTAEETAVLTLVDVCGLVFRLTERAWHWKNFVLATLAWSLSIPNPSRIRVNDDGSILLDGRRQLWDGRPSDHIKNRLCWFLKTLIDQRGKPISQPRLMLIGERRFGDKVFRYDQQRKKLPSLVNELITVVPGGMTLSEEAFDKGPPPKPSPTPPTWNRPSTERPREDRASD